MLSSFQMIGQNLFFAGLNNSHSGNISIRIDDKIIITRRGSMLGNLSHRDLITTSLYKIDDTTCQASSELGVHKAIYLNTPALAILHAHPPHVIALSLLEKNQLIPIDAEGLYLLPSVPVLSPGISIASQELESTLPTILKDNRIAVIKGHGTFAIGKDLVETLHLTSSLEHSCKILSITRQIDY
ncbi:MAG: aldolase [Peptococcaceae bacterium]|nr:aldolase [Peptococcaceae bacterium]